MSRIVRLRLDPETPSAQWPGRIDTARVDATDEKAIAVQLAEDEAAARAAAAAYVRRVRQRLGLSQAEFARCIQVSVATVRDWERGRQLPQGAARALLKVLDRAPEAALAALR